MPGVFVLERNGGIASFGRPRDGDPRAAYTLLDAEPDARTLVRVPYAVASTQAKMRAAGLPEDLAARLPLGR